MHTRPLYKVHLRRLRVDSDGLVIGHDDSVVECDTLKVEEIAGDFTTFVQVVESEEIQFSTKFSLGIGELIIGQRL